MAKFEVIYCDPPWEFRTRSQKGKGKSAEQHYPCMKLKDIFELPVKEIAAADCALFLWTTGPHLHNAFKLLEEWHFQYKALAFDWLKLTKNAHQNFLKILADTGDIEEAFERSTFFGNGYYTRANTELCLLATRGKPKRESRKVREPVVTVIGEHSAKPPIVRTRIEELMGSSVNRCELFARTVTPGWTCLGNEIDGLDIKTALDKLRDQ